MVTLPRWLEWTQEIQALAQTGDHHAEIDCPTIFD